MKMVLAISGGVDSMVMLHFCRQKYDSSDIIVAHFDHGTRRSSKTDAEFVEKCCKNYNILFYRGEGHLGEGVSEEKARKARYEFFGKVIKEIEASGEKAKLLTAHHLDDLCETAVINCLRGTGFRGLAALNNHEVERPLLAWTKNDILKYACKNGIVFREDPTNSSSEYLRNRLRKKVRELDLSYKQEILELRNRQCEIEDEISQIVNEIIPEIKDNSGYFREVFLKMPDEVAGEVLRNILIFENIRLTRPQIENLLDAVRNYLPGKKFNLPKDRFIEIKKRTFRILR